MKLHLFILASAILVGCEPAAVPTNNRSPQFPLTRYLPPAPGDEGGFEQRRLYVSNSSGWLIVSLVSVPIEPGVDRRIEWQCVLARLDQRRVPAIETDQSGQHISVTYGNYFVRESPGWLRILREKKSDAWDWEMIGGAPATPALIESGHLSLALNSEKYAVYAHPEAGDRDIDVVARVILPAASPTVQGTKTASISKLQFAGYGCLDEGDLFVLTRQQAENTPRSRAESQSPAIPAALSGEAR